MPKKPRIKGKVNIKMFPNDVVSAFKDASLPRMLKAGAIVERQAKLSMNVGGRTKKPAGRDARGKFTKGAIIQTPSDPGQPPNVQTGNLRNSITHAPTRRGTVIVGPGARIASYGKIHEKGGQYGGRNYPARPFMRPAMNNSRRDIRRVMKGLPAAKTVAGRRLNAKRKRRNVRKRR